MEKDETAENGYPNHTSENNIDSKHKNGILEDQNKEDEKLRGDAIGNTVYSQRFVLETLIKLKDENWDAEIEEDMCNIWDMTLDKDVVDFLLDNHFIDLSMEIVKQSKELRLIEILVGIIGNMCIHQVASEKTIESDNFDVLLSLVFSHDTPTLIQLMRLFKTLLFCKNIDCKSIITDDILNQINFILNNSKNTELLGYTLQVTGEVTNKDNSVFLKIHFLESLTEAFHEIMDDSNKVDLDQKLKHLSTYLKIIENACTLINDEKDSGKIKDIINNFTGSSIKENVCIFQEYLEQFASVEFLLHESQSLEYFIYCSVNFLVSFQTVPNVTIFEYFIEIYNKIIENDLKDSFETDVCEYISNYFMYFVENTKIEKIKDGLKNRTKLEIKHFFLDEISKTYECTDKFKSIFKELSS